MPIRTNLFFIVAATCLFSGVVGIKILHSWGPESLFRASITIVIPFTLATALALLGASVAVRQVSRRLQFVNLQLQKLAAGVYDLPMREETGDEMAGIWKSMRLLAQAMAEAEQLQRSQTQAEVQRAGAMEEVAQLLETNISGPVRKLSFFAEGMQAAAQSLVSTALITSEQGRLVLTSGTETSSNVHAVAAATEELATSATQVGQQITDSVHICLRAHDEVKRTSKTVGTLAEAADNIGAVARTISNIAGQTNLLALNATIEAARAGSAGRGFAVVAAEVKALAVETARATEEITTSIGQIRSATDLVVDTIQAIDFTMEEMNDIASAVAAAAAQQQATTSEIALRIAEVARRAQEVGDTVTGTLTAADETGSSANQVLAIASELARTANALQRGVDQLLDQVRSSQSSVPALPPAPLAGGRSRVSTVRG
jgi:methyl-accepting chemotaxis protein